MSSSFLPFTPKRNQVSYESRAGRQSHETGDVTPRARSRVSPRDRGGTVQRHTGRRTRADGRALASPISVSVLMSPGLLSSRHDTSEEIGTASPGSAGQTGRVQLHAFKLSFRRLTLCVTAKGRSFIHPELSDRGRLRAKATSLCIFRLPRCDTDAHGMGGDATCHLCPTSFFPPLCTCARLNACCMHGHFLGQGIRGSGEGIFCCHRILPLPSLRLRPRPRPPGT